MSTCCHFTPVNGGRVWSTEDTAQPTAATPGATDIYRPDILEHIEATIKGLDEELRELSLNIHGMLSESTTHKFRSQ